MRSSTKCRRGALPKRARRNPCLRPLTAQPYRPQPLAKQPRQILTAQPRCLRQLTMRRRQMRSLRLTAQPRHPRQPTTSPTQAHLRRLTAQPPPPPRPMAEPTRARLLQVPTYLQRVPRPRSIALTRKVRWPSLCKLGPTELHTHYRSSAHVDPLMAARENRDAGKRSFAAS